MNHYDYATALALGLDRWAKPKNLKPHELELVQRTRFEESRDAGKKLKIKNKWRFWPVRVRPGLLAKLLF